MRHYSEAPCLATIFVTQYWQLWVTRAFTGVAVGGALPLVFSLAGDMFPPDQRSHASSIIGLCMMIGISLGQAVAGYMGPTYGWRLPFVVVAVPGIIVAVLFFFTVSEPKRGKGGAG